MKCGCPKQCVNSWCKCQSISNCYRSGVHEHIDASYSTANKDLEKARTDPPTVSVWLAESGLRL